jgi:hypothetical protein
MSDDNKTATQLMEQEIRETEQKLELYGKLGAMLVFGILVIVIVMLIYEVNTNNVDLTSIITIILMGTLFIVSLIFVDLRKHIQAIIQFRKDSEERYKKNQQRDMWGNLISK